MLSGVYLNQTSLEGIRYLIGADWLELLPVAICDATTGIDLNQNAPYWILSCLEQRALDLRRFLCNLEHC